MSGHRTCGKRCHNARRVACRCWCGGLFHGERGAAARDAFVEAFGGPIPDRDPRDTEPLLHWTGAESRFTAALECAIAASSDFSRAREAFHYEQPASATA